MVSCLRSDPLFHTNGAKLLLVFVVWLLPIHSAVALITGAEGNQPLTNRGWPQGADSIFNNAARIAWWEGPPFGGGQYHAEFRADVKTLNAILTEFAKLDAKTKRVIVHDGVGRSFWLNPNREPGKDVAAMMDFRFMVWSRANWERLKKLPADLNPVNAKDVDNGPPMQIDVYTGGNIRWSEVKVPKGLPITDKRLVAHGFTPADGIVIQGKAIDLVTNQPIAAVLQLELIEPRKTGGYDYSVVAETTADQKGHFVLKKAPAGWHRISLKAKGYIPRIIGHIQSDQQPRWHWYESGLCRPTTVSGKVTDRSGKPIAEVNVQLSNITSKVDGRYDSPLGYATMTDSRGEFTIENVPEGSASIRVSKVGYCRPGLAKAISTPIQNAALKMMRSAFLRVTVEFGNQDRPKAYIVNLEPEGGSVVGSWGGSGKIDENNEMVFKNVPPGKYVVQGHPNPTSEKQKTEKIKVELKGGKTKRVVLHAK